MSKMDSSPINFGPLFIAFAAFIWATDSFVRGRFKATFSSAQVVFLEHLIILIIISPLVIKFGPKLFDLNSKEWFSVLFIGIGGSALATIAFTQGLFMGELYPYQYIAIIVFVQQIQPVFAVGFAHLFLKERLPSFFYILSAIAFFGVMLIVFPILTNDANEISSLRDLPNNLKTNQGIQAASLALIAAFLWGSSTVFGRYLLEHGEQKLEYVQMTTYRFLIGAVFLTVFTPIYGLYRTDLGGYPELKEILIPKIFLYLMYVSLIVGLVSLVSYYYGLKTTHASVSAIFELAFPISFYIIMPILDIKFPDTIQIIGSIVLIASATLLSYNYGKLQPHRPRDMIKPAKT